MSSTVNAVRDGEEQPGQNIDAVIDAIAKDRRRILLDVLDDEGGGTFSEVVARVSEEIYGTDYSSKERKRVYVSLYQNHVPVSRDGRSRVRGDRRRRPDLPGSDVPGDERRPRLSPA